MLTQERLKELLHYDPKTGVFVWSLARQGVKVGSVAGSLSRGYLVIRVVFRKYSAHRLVWLHEYGYLPENMIDHIDRDKTNNRLNNLREVSDSCNQRNTGLPANNTSGIKGVSWARNPEEWRAQIEINNKVIHLCYSADRLEAACHRLAAEQAEDWAGCDSSSPAYQYVKKHIQAIK